MCYDAEDKTMRMDKSRWPSINAEITFGVSTRESGEKRGRDSTGSDENVIESEAGEGEYRILQGDISGTWWPRSQCRCADVEHHAYANTGREKLIECI